MGGCCPGLGCEPQEGVGGCRSWESWGVQWLLLALLGPLDLPQTGALADCSECTSTSLNFKSTFQSPVITYCVLIASPAIQIKVQPVV